MTPRWPSRSAGVTVSTGEMLAKPVAAPAK
jgi:hypothetical protein